MADPREEPWPVPRIWEGATVAILAGGPSLDTQQLHRLALARLGGQIRVLALKQSVYLSWGWADWCHWSGDLAHLPRGPLSGVAEPPRIKTYSWRHPIPDELWRSPLPGWRAVSPLIDGVELSTVGAQGAAIAALAGAARILLLGVDGTDTGHWHRHTPPAKHGEDRLLRSDIAWLVEPMRRRGVEVLNCSPGTQVLAFPLAVLADALPVAH